MDSIELHELYKQRSTSETWIEQVKGHTMAGSTLTNDFWANDILWQLNVYICINEKRHKFLINPLWQKKYEIREHYTENQ